MIPRSRACRSPRRRRLSMPPKREFSGTASSDSLWTIVLAAGEGRRLCSLTRALHGEDLPKQYALIRSQRSLLQETVSRAIQWSAPSRIVVVVAADRENIAREQLRSHDGLDVVVQPRNRGTGAGILLPLARVLAKEPNAQVVILPSDHYVREEYTFAESVLRAQRTAQASNSVVLLAATPDRAETQYGWIVPDRSAAVAGAFRVARFHEKPPAALARSLYLRGALWNTFIMTGTVSRFWELARHHLPLQSALFTPYCRHIGTEREAAFLQEIYERLVPADFSRDVIEKADGLGVETLGPCGWSDWGTPERVLHSLQGTREWAELMAKLVGRLPLDAGRALPAEIRHFECEPEEDLVVV